jgi:hypothetical protein
MVVSFIGGGNWRKPLTCGKSHNVVHLAMNFIDDRKKDKKKNNGPQNTLQNTKDRATFHTCYI